jgi:hypothetical protein
MHTTRASMWLLLLQLASSGIAVTRGWRSYLHCVYTRFVCTSRLLSDLYLLISSSVAWRLAGVLQYMYVLDSR